tara:strand:+ start:98 stop:262 length:165 start_codon:yes stop_codon:yes gene_type:complete
MTEPKVKFRKLTVYYVAFDEDDKDISSNIDWIVGQADQTDLRVADYEIEEWNND